jgi:hypothetical protein
VEEGAAMTRCRDCEILEMAVKALAARVETLETAAGNSWRSDNEPLGAIASRQPQVDNCPQPTDPPVQPRRPKVGDVVEVWCEPCGSSGGYWYQWTVNDPAGPSWEPSRYGTSWRWPAGPQGAGKP